jgi:hypothetical protein
MLLSTPAGCCAAWAYLYRFLTKKSRVEQVYWWYAKRIAINCTLAGLAAWGWDWILPGSTDILINRSFCRIMDE